MTKLFWEVTPADKHDFVADPKKARATTGAAPSIFALGSRDRRRGRDADAVRRFHRRRLSRLPRRHAGVPRPPRPGCGAMEAEGFTVYKYEWWYFDY
ncbi:MAG: hypothetical protein R2862_04270 [Thermoanaerobaculia bacterium]